MLKMEFRICSKCGKTYVHTGGGVVSTPHDLDYIHLCGTCRAKEAKRILGKILGKGVKKR